MARGTCPSCGKEISFGFAHLETVIPLSKRPKFVDFVKAHNGDIAPLCEDCNTVYNCIECGKYLCDPGRMNENSYTPYCIECTLARL